MLIALKRKFFFLIFIYAINDYGQQTKFVPFVLKTNFGIATKPFLFISNTGLPFYLQTNYCFAKQSHQNKKPIFCRMEDKLYKRLNVWVVFRAGSDDAYKKLIELPLIYDKK